MTNHTVELGDIEQLQELENAELLQTNYTEGVVAQAVVQSVEDGDFS